MDIPRATKPPSRTSKQGNKAADRGENGHRPHGCRDGPRRHRSSDLPREQHGEQRAQHPGVAFQPAPPPVVVGGRSRRRQPLVRAEPLEEKQQRSVAGGHERRRADVASGRGSVTGRGGCQGHKKEAQANENGVASTSVHSKLLGKLGCGQALVGTLMWFL
jgi:hypothetical protein